MKRIVVSLLIIISIILVSFAYIIPLYNEHRGIGTNELNSDAALSAFTLLCLSILSADAIAFLGLSQKKRAVFYISFAIHVAAIIKIFLISITL